MRILVVAQWYPMPDRTAGDLRFFHLLKILAQENDVSFCVSGDLEWQHTLIGPEGAEIHRDALAAMGIRVLTEGVRAAVNSHGFDAVLFEFYFCAEHLIDDVKFKLRRTPVIVDSVDVAYNRFRRKADLTGKPEDHERASDVKRRELGVYNKADLVIAVTEEDRRLLVAKSKTMRVKIIPTIHDVPPLDAAETRLTNQLIFVGSFLHDPNTDAMLYFCRDVFPLIRREFPEIKLRIIGTSPPQAIKDLASDDVSVLGYVPDLTPYLYSSYVSIAPLRYGGGMKGKICEAMAHGLPVVTTSIGIEGIGLTPMENVLVGDTPEKFAQATCSLLRQKTLHDGIRQNGWSFIRNTYSEEAVAGTVHRIFAEVSKISVKRLPIGPFLRRAVPYELDRRLLWRFKTETPPVGD